MSSITAAEVVQRFVGKINARDVDAIVGLMTDDHRFIDSLGAEVVGRDKVRHGWEEYFRMVPDYRVEVRETFSDGQVVVFLGVARGTYTRNGTLRAGNSWETPAAWRAGVSGDRVAEWQVYADNEPIRRRMRDDSA